MRQVLPMRPPVRRNTATCAADSHFITLRVIGESSPSGRGLGCFATSLRGLPRRSRASTAGLLGAFAARDLGRERFEWRIPELPKAREPGIDLGEGTGVDGVQPARAIDAYRRKSALAQHLQVLGD